MPVAFLLQGAGVVFYGGLALILLGFLIEKVKLLAFLKDLKDLVDGIGWVAVFVYFAYLAVTAVQAGKWF